MLPIFNVSYWAPPPLSLTEHFRPEHVTQTAAKKWTPHTQRKIFSQNLLFEANKHKDIVKFAFFIMIMRRWHKRRFSRIYFSWQRCLEILKNKFNSPSVFRIDWKWGGEEGRSPKTFLPFIEGNLNAYIPRLSWWSSNESMHKYLQPGYDRRNP